MLTVLSISMALMMMLLMMYEDTAQSQSEQKHHMLRHDYHQREGAFLSALTNIIPNKAMRCMMEGANADTDLDWTSIFSEAMVQANAEQALNGTEAAALGVDTMRTTNTANTTLDIANVVKSVFSADGLISSGTNSTGSSSLTYPSVLECSSTIEEDDENYPIISHLKSNGTSHQFGKIPSPSLHFSYKNDSNLIAKHNWWTFQVSFDDHDAENTELAREHKQYLVSLYEVPAQLAINSAAYTNFGQHEDGTDWGDITVTGGVFAKGVKLQGDFSSDSISSQKGVELADASNPFATDNEDRNDALYKGEGSAYSSSSEGGRVAFIPINRGTAFFTRTADVTKTPEDNQTGITAASSGSTAWDYYSIGANQCVMSVIDDKFYYLEDGNTALTEVDLTATEEAFTYATSAAGEICINVNMEKLLDFLGPDAAINNSLCINSDRYVLLSRADDLTAFSNGFSIVCDKRLILDGDINITAYAGETNYPALSSYAPEHRYGNGDGNGTLKVEIIGGLGSTADGTSKDNAVNIGDIRVNGETAVRPADIKATLTSITELENLPPINMMNWMVVIRETH